MTSDKNKIQLRVQFFGEEAITFHHKTNNYSQIEDPPEDPYERENINISKKIWEEQNFQRITIPEDEILTNKDICQFIYTQLQHFKQDLKQNNQNQDHNQNLENDSLNKHILDKILFKLIEQQQYQDDFKEIIQQPQPEVNSNNQINGKSVPTTKEEMQINDNNSQVEFNSD